MKNGHNALILGIETSCDETAAAVVADGRTVLSNMIASQVNIHREYGGVVPEIAARKHMDSISYIVGQALNQANVKLSDISAIAVSNGPGLVGALLVGLSFAKALAFSANIPLYGVHHIYSHICANYLETDWQPPFICLIASGGHTHLVKVESFTKCTVLGRTRDDAAGEAFDKVGRTMGLPYPGGPEIDRLAKEGDPTLIPFPRTIFEDSLDFSFSGLKSAVLQHLQKHTPKNTHENRKENTKENKEENKEKKSNIASAFQQAVLDVLVTQTIKACAQTGLSKVALAGGVAANNGLRQAITKACSANNITLHLPSAVYCTDNAAMVAGSGYYRHLTGIADDYDLNAYPNMDILT